jgi:hypothetical protein
MHADIVMYDEFLRLSCLLATLDSCVNNEWY